MAGCGVRVVASTGRGKTRFANRIQHHGFQRKPRIGAFFSAIRERSCRFAGIINSDRQIVGYPGWPRASSKASKAALCWNVPLLLLKQAKI